MDNGVMEIIDTLYNMVSEAWNVPMGNGKCIIEREKTLQLIEELKSRLPSELSEAKRLVSAREEFIGNAKREAEAMRRTAEEKARELTDQEEIVRVAKAKAAETTAAAERKSRDLRRAANEYVDDALRRTEEAVSAALGEIKTSREQFLNIAGEVEAHDNIKYGNSAEPKMEYVDEKKYK